MPASTPAPKIPSTLKVVTILWLVAGVVLVLNSSLCLAMWRYGSFRERIASGPQTGPFALFRYYGLGAALQLIGALVLIAGTLTTLRRKRLGRVLFQAACLYGVSFGLAFDVVWSSPLFEPAPPGVDTAFFLLVVIVGLVTSVPLFLAPPALTAWYLARSETKAVFEQWRPVA